MTQVANRAAGGAVAALSQLKQHLQTYTQAIPTAGGEPFMRMQKDGQWVYGAENIEVEEGSVWAVNPFSFKHGYSCWTDYPAETKKKNVKKGEVMVGMNQEKPALESLPKHERDDGVVGFWEWRDCNSFQLRCTNGTDKGEQTLYNTTSVGGLGAIAGLTNAIMAQLDKDIDHPVALIELTSSSYIHKQWGKTYTPVLQIVGWDTMDGDDFVEVEAEEAKEPEPAPEPVKPTRTRAVKTPAPDRGPIKAKEPDPATQTASELEGEDEEAVLLRQLAEAKARKAAAAAVQQADQATSKPSEATGGADDGIRRRRRPA